MAFNFKNATVLNFAFSGLAVAFVILVASFGGCNG